MTTEMVVHQETSIVKVVESDLWAREEAIRAILPDSMDLRRFVKTAMIALSKNPDLHRCTRESIVRSIIEAAEAGLEPTGMLGRAWLVPYSNKGVAEAQLQIGYQGLIDLARRSGEVRKIVARVVYEGDKFRVFQGSDERVVHEPAYLTEDPLKIEKFYAVVTFMDGNTQHEVMSKAQVDQVRSKAKAKNAAAWTESYPEMGRKTVVRRLAKYLPLTPEAVDAISKDDEREFGPQTPNGPVGARTSSLRESIKAQAAEVKVIEVPAVEIPDGPIVTEEGVLLNAAEVAEGAPALYADVAPDPVPEKCGALSDPALGEIELCDMAYGHLKVKGSKQQHRSRGGSTWPA